MLARRKPHVVTHNTSDTRARTVKRRRFIDWILPLAKKRSVATLKAVIMHRMHELPQAPIPLNYAAE